MFPGEVHSHFSVTVGDDEYRFDTADEMIRQAASTLPALVHDFSLRLDAAEEYRYISVIASAGVRPYVSVRASDYGWCAGVIATSQRTIQRGKRWYSSLRRWHFWLLATVVGTFPAILLYAFNVKLDLGPLGNLAWGLLTAVLWVIFFAFDRLFPAASLVIREEESWVKRHAAVLTVVLALAALVVTILDLFLK